MDLVHLLYFCAAKYNINVCITYIPGINNDIADCLSRYKQDKFQMLAPKANYAQDITPAWPTNFTEASCNTSLMELPHPPLIARAYHLTPLQSALQNTPYLKIIWLTSKHNTLTSIAPCFHAQLTLIIIINCNSILCHN